MSLTSSMWTGVSGMLAHGEKMNVIGNNIANVNTIGFKSQRMDFSDLMYSDSYNNGGLNQVGHGTSVHTIITSFAQGPYEATTNPTDLAISGSGFFQVRQPNTEQVYYTRAGDFTFDKEGNLVDPNNYILQGWKIDNTGGVTRASGGLTANANENQSAVLGTGAPQDIKLDAWTIQPFATSEVTFIPNLSRDEGVDNISDNSNPFTGMFNLWDGTQPPSSPDTPPIPDTGYSYLTPIDVYDEAGVKHTLTVYYDKVDPNDYEGGENGGTMWEYIVTMDPAEDQRQFVHVDPFTGEQNVIDLSSTKSAGMLAAGTISFNSAGQATNQSCYTFLGGSSPDTEPTDFTQVWDEASGTFKSMPTADPTDMANWQTAEVSANGYPIIVANFSGIMDAQTSGSTKGDDYGIELSFGMKASNINSPWSPSRGSLADLTVPPYEYNPDHVDGNPATGPEYYLRNDANYDAGLERDIEIAFDDAETSWDALGFTRLDPGTGNTVPVSLEQVINDPTLIGQINSAAPADAAGANAIIATMNADIDAAVAASGGPITNAFQYVLAGTATREQQIQYLFNTNNGGANIDRSIFSSATPANATELTTFAKPVEIQDQVIQSNAGPSATYSSSQNGYGFGNLSSYYVDERGVLAGVYSNGVTQELYQIVLYDFTSTQNLYREGGNLYSQTLASGDPKSGPAGVAGLGTISSYTIEQSNVDLATEFVLMITTQRGYQGNSKVVTTVDTMLESVIGLVR